MTWAGDFYDLIDFGTHGVAAVIGDVRGHGVQAAALMGQIRTTVHSYARMGASPEEVLTRTNRMLLELDSPMYCSCLYAHIDVRGNRAVLASAGHPPPILCRPSHRTEVLAPPPGPLLGVDAKVHFRTLEVPLLSGAVLALYTDGLVQRSGSELGGSIDLLAGRLAKVGGESLDAVADRVVQGAQAVVPQNRDDIALMLVRRASQEETVLQPGSASPQRSVGEQI